MAGPAYTENVSELSALFKDVYGDGIKEQQNTTPLMYKRFKKSTRRAGGNVYRFACRMGMPQSLGNRPYRTALPTPKRTDDVNGEVRLRFFYATGDVAGPDLRKGKRNPEAFVDIQTDKMEALTKSALQDLNFQFYLAGDGAYARVVSLPGTISKVGVDTIKYLRAGRRVDLWDDSGNAIGEAAATNNRAILACTVEGGVPTVQFKNDSSGAALARDGSQGGGFVAAGSDLIIPETGLSAASAAAGMFFNGLKAIVDDGSQVNVFQNINRTTYPGWKAKVLSNGGSARPLTLQLMQLAWDIPGIMGGESPSMVLCSPNGRNLYLQLLTSQRRFMTGKMDGGYETLEFNGKQLVVDKDCQDDRMYFLNESHIEHYGVMDLELDDEDGSILKHGGLSSGDVYYFFMKAYANFGSDRCNTHAVVTDLEVDTNYLLAA